MRAVDSVDNYMARRWMKAVVTGAARAMGYVPTGTDIAKRLAALQGDFQPSAGELAPYGLITAIVVFMSASFTFMALNTFREGLDIDVAWFLVAMASVFLVLSVGLVYFMGQRYVFSNGTITCIWINGKVIWHESLTVLQ